MIENALTANTMTGATSITLPTELDEATLGRAAARWGAFFASIDDAECELLDRFALGGNLKSVCFELGLSYDMIRKRLVRRQHALGLPSTATFLHFWMTVRGLGQTDSDPTMLRYAELLRASLGYAPSMVLPVPETTPATLRLQARVWRPAASMVMRDRADAEAMTMAVLSPVAWHALLVVSNANARTRESAHPVSITAQHELFRIVVLPQRSGALGNRLRELIDQALCADEALTSAKAAVISTPWLRMMLFSATISSAVLSAAPPTPWTVHRPALATVEDATAFSPSLDYQFACNFLEATGRGSVPEMQRLLGSVDDDNRFGPLTGFVLALAFFRASSPRLRAVTSPVINRMISSRVHLAQSLSIHPTRLLAALAMQDSGMSDSPVRHQLICDERLAALSAEQLLPEVRDLSSTGDGSRSNQPG